MLSQNSYCTSLPQCPGSENYMYNLHTHLIPPYPWSSTSSKWLSYIFSEIITILIIKTLSYVLWILMMKKVFDKFLFGFEISAFFENFFYSSLVNNAQCWMVGGKVEQWSTIGLESLNEHYHPIKWDKAQSSKI